jgi:hypothetical protein
MFGLSDFLAPLIRQMLWIQFFFLFLTYTCGRKLHDICIIRLHYKIDSSPISWANEHDEKSSLENDNSEFDVVLTITFTE